MDKCDSVPTAFSLARNFRLRPIVQSGDLAHFGELSRAELLLELAWDGHRVLATRRGSDVHIASADFQQWHELFAPIAVALRQLPVEDAVIEGHLCALDAQGRPDFAALRRFARGARDVSVAFAAWDLLWCDGEDLREHALGARRARLQQLLELKPSSILWSEALEGTPSAVLEAVRAMGIRGVVARPKASTYASRDDEWVAWSSEVQPIKWDRSLSPPPTVSNATKVLFPRDGLTKKDVVAYYRDIAPVLLPHIRDRPVVAQRWPDGIDAFTWYQHRVPPRAPDYLRPTIIDGNRRIVIESEDALLWLVNLAAITFHGWTSRVGSLHHPDWAILDLDPGAATSWEETIAVAVAVRRLLEMLELPSVVKTSGQRGLHVLVPLAPGQSPAAASRFALGAATMVARLMPSVVSVSAIPNERRGRLYLDHLQGFVGKALVLPYAPPRQRRRAGIDSHRMARGVDSAPAW